MVDECALVNDIVSVLDAKALSLDAAAGRADTLLERACLEARAAGVHDAVAVVRRAARGRETAA